MLGKVVVVAGVGAAYLLRTRGGQQQVAAAVLQGVHHRAATGCSGLEPSGVGSSPVASSIATVT